VPKSRGSTVPAGRVFSLQATRLVSSTRRPVGLEAKNTGFQAAHNLAWKLWQRCSTARLVPRSTRYLCHNEQHLIGLLTICSRGLCPVRLPHGSRCRGAPLIDCGGGDDGLPVYRSSAVLAASEDTSRRCSPQGAIAGEPGTRTPQVAVITFGGREISTIETCTDGASCCLLAGANGAAWISAAERVKQRLGVPPLDVCISLRCGAGRC
jgi:hypothetical protein